MTSVGVALMWIVLSAASAKCLAAFARAATSSNMELELATSTADGAIDCGGPYFWEADTQLPHTDI